MNIEFLLNPTDLNRSARCRGRSGSSNYRNSRDNSAVALKSTFLPDVIRDQGLERNVVSETFTPPTNEKVKRDLDYTLGNSFDFLGQYCHAATTPAPNPDIHIEGFGAINLPLNSSGTERLRAYSSESSTGDFWHVAADKIKINNPAWDYHLDNIIARDIWLSLVPYEPRPKFTFSKMIMYWAGSSLTHQEQILDENVYATLDVILPSVHSGGQIEISHEGAVIVYDIAPAATPCTAVVSWHNDASIKIKPITSGHRLVLRYLMAHQASGPIPRLPHMQNSTIQLRRILDQWLQSSSQEQLDVAHGMFIYTLHHDYRGLPLEGCILRGEDAHKVAHLRPVCNELGIGLYLGRIKCHITGTSDDRERGYSKGYGRRRRTDWCADDEKYPPLVKTTKRAMVLEEMTDLRGNAMEGFQGMELSKNDLMVRKPFDHFHLDTAEYSGYNDTEPGIIKYSYRRAVLIMFDPHTGFNVALSTGQHMVAVARLDGIKQGQVTNRNRDNVRKIISALHHNKPSWDVVAAIAKLTIKWNDPKLWESIISSGLIDGQAGSLGHVHCSKACSVFSFVTVLKILQRYCQKVGLPAIKAVASFPSLVGPEHRIVAIRWVRERIRWFLSSGAPLSTDDVTSFFSIGRCMGIPFLCEVIVPELLAKCRSPVFSMSLIGLLHWERVYVFPFNPSTHMEGKNRNIVEQKTRLLKPLVQKMLQQVIMEWHYSFLDLSVSDPTLGSSTSVLSGSHYTVSLSNAANLICLCILTQNIGSCALMFKHLLNRRWDASASTRRMFDVVYAPLIPLIRDTLQKFKMEVWSPVSAEFFRVLVYCYLRFILGPRPSASVNIKLTCGCGWCQQLVRFFSNAYFEQALCFGRLADHQHIQQSLQEIKQHAQVELLPQCGWESRLDIIKRRAAWIDTHWSVKRRQAETFLGLIGDENVIKKLMGDGFAAVTDALDGRRWKLSEDPETFGEVIEPSTASDSQWLASRKVELTVPIRPLLSGH
ncbi:hypothetical protein SERLA73DRAFT_76258 [Serpula lacrymans var. lacrymans S7.3]|uniref:Uncharacterized protein n=1 Tax=Serpula lacrymans var. lacrymans (strain S7.3) TaxID=936435 RepID=F8Q6P1_SERL3|nr:hypothetical protein SERLA73DRAFT_76258 [Serpula lacrymans var. lacrymans S7.3]